MTTTLLRHSKTSGSILAALACALMAGTSPLQAADVTYERLLNPEPQNWLSHHRDYGSQRHSPLERSTSRTSRT
jgi:alcohol dehydrogenase (cytochrome c)